MSDLDQSTPVPLGNAFGQIYPPVSSIPAPSVDPRTTALRLLGRYIAGITFFRPGSPGSDDVPFTITADRFLIEMADHEQELKFPCLVVVSAEPETYDAPGFTSDLEETSTDVYGRGTVLQVQYEQTEFIGLEIWASSKPERRAVLSGLQVAFNPTEQQYGIRFAMSDYYDQQVCFTPWSAQRIDDDGVRGRWRARMRIEMRFNVVRPVNYVALQQPRTVVEVLPEEVALPGGLYGPEQATRDR